MRDLAIDYGLLAQLARTAREAADLLQQMSGSAASSRVGDDSSLRHGSTNVSELGLQLDDFHSRWSVALSNASDKAKSLGELTDQLAKEWFDADAGLAAQFLARISATGGSILEERARHPLTGQQEQQLPPELPSMGWYAKTLPNGASQAAIRHPDGTTVITVNGPTGLLYTQSIRSDGDSVHMAVQHGDGRTQSTDLVRNKDGSLTQTVRADGRTTVLSAAAGSDDFVLISESGPPQDSQAPEQPTPTASAASSQSYW
ncbi:hypothetical protein BX265_6905 [Streptomyces sp. TLI_235]|nr:hypothetical protein [Streptomyces sp. TLI_235]PBC69574.1 hypothetical protein BX265_6905 [Streptomyces sp. TLI_235]